MILRTDREPILPSETTKESGEILAELNEQVARMLGEIDKPVDPYVGPERRKWRSQR